MDLKNKESTFVTLNKAIEEYFGGDRLKLIELAIAHRVRVWINMAGTKVPLARPGEYRKPKAEDLSGMEPFTLLWFTPIDSNQAVRFLRGGTTAVHWVWYRSRELAVDEKGKYIPFSRVGLLPEIDRVAWFAFEGFGEPIPTDFDTAYVSRRDLKHAALAYYSATADVTTPGPLTKWPWGDYETTLLKHLAAAAREYWTSYVPGGPAPKKDEVVAWLKQAPRSVSDRSALAIDTILRAENLPPGPRPRNSTRQP